MRTAFAALIVLALLAACGGDGRRGGPRSPPPSADAGPRRVPSWTEQGYMDGDECVAWVVRPEGGVITCLLPLYRVVACVGPCIPTVTTAASRGDIQCSWGAPDGKTRVECPTW